MAIDTIQGIEMYDDKEHNLTYGNIFYPPSNNNHSFALSEDGMILVAWIDREVPPYGMYLHLYLYNPMDDQYYLKKVETVGIKGISVGSYDGFLARYINIDGNNLQVYNVVTTKKIVENEEYITATTEPMDVNGLDLSNINDAMISLDGSTIAVYKNEPTTESTIITKLIIIRYDDDEKKWVVKSNEHSMNLADGKPEISKNGMYVICRTKDDDGLDILDIYQYNNNNSYIKYGNSIHKNLSHVRISENGKILFGFYGDYDVKIVMYKYDNDEWKKLEQEIINKGDFLEEGFEVSTNDDGIFIAFMQKFENVDDDTLNIMKFDPETAEIEYTFSSSLGNILAIRITKSFEIVAKTYNSVMFGKLLLISSTSPSSDPDTSPSSDPDTSSSLKYIGLLIFIWIFFTSIYIWIQRRL